MCYVTKQGAGEFQSYTSSSRGNSFSGALRGATLSTGIPPLMVAVPAEGVLHDLVEGGELGLPTDVSLQRGGIGDELRRVAGAARLDSNGHRCERDSLHHVYDFS